MRLHVGTSGYNFDEWKGTFYPEKLPADQWLGYYAGRLQTVEINYTFYRMPNAKTIGHWLEVTPDGFTFVLKVSQRITHHARLKEVEQPLKYFIDTAAQLGPKLGPLLFQLPPNFKKDADRLGEVLRLVPDTIRTAWEFRHESWFADDVYATPRCASRTTRRATRPPRPRRTSGISGCGTRDTPARTWPAGPARSRRSVPAGARRSSSSSMRKRGRGPRWRRSSRSCSSRAPASSRAALLFLLWLFPSRGWPSALP